MDFEKRYRMFMVDLRERFQDDSARAGHRLTCDGTIRVCNTVDVVKQQLVNGASQQYHLKTEASKFACDLQFFDQLWQIDTWHLITKIMSNQKM